MGWGKFIGTAVLFGAYAYICQGTCDRAFTLLAPLIEVTSLSTLHYCNAPSFATRLTGNYRDRTYTGKCDPALLARHKRGAIRMPIKHVKLHPFQSYIIIPSCRIFCVSDFIASTFSTFFQSVPHL